MEDEFADINLDEIERIENESVSIRMRDSLLEFTKEMWTVLEPDTTFVVNWHIEELCKVLEGVANGTIKRVIINVPPGTLKSLLVSVFFPAWLWARNPRKRVLTAAYGSHLTTRDNLRVRDIIQSPKFQRYFRVDMVEDQNTKTRYNTTAGGWRIATSVGGVGTGEHPDLIIIDDALTAAQAESEPERTAANNWFDRTISSRGVSRGVSIIVIGQRLHEEDLPGYLLKKDRDGWYHINYPMRYETCKCPGAPSYDEVPPAERAMRLRAHVKGLEESDRCKLHKQDPLWVPDPTDPRRVEGELLMPQIFTEAKVAQLELDLGPYGTAGQLQQRPSPEGGGLFKAEYFEGKFVDEVFALYIACRGWDTAATEGDGDYTAGPLLLAELKSTLVNKREVLELTGRIMVAHVEHEQYGPDKVADLILDTANADKVRKGCKAYAIREEKEGGSAGKAVITERAKLLAGFDYEGVTISGNKITRAKPFRAQCAAGNVYILRGHWNAKYIRELCGFPAASNDDLVDGSSTAYNGLVEMELPQSDWVSW